MEYCLSFLKGMSGRSVGNNLSKNQKNVCKTVFFNIDLPSKTTKKRVKSDENGQRFFSSPYITLETIDKFKKVLGQNKGKELAAILKENRSKRLKIEAELHTEDDDQGFKQVIAELRTQSDEIETIRKERVFEDEITLEEMDIIQRRVYLQQRQFEEYERREKANKIMRIKRMFEHLKINEIQMALKKTNYNEEETILNFTKYNYLHEIRKSIAIEAINNFKKYKNKNNNITKELNIGNEMITSPSIPIKSKSQIAIEKTEKEEEEDAYTKLIAKRKKVVKKITTEESKLKCFLYARVTLDDAMKKLEQGKATETELSLARRRAWELIEKKPNSYYYRFNAAGELQRNGKWTDEEKELFIKRLKEVGADGQWGIFSMAIPGRVGYQCSNFYRSLLKSGELKDSKYQKDEASGKLQYLFGKDKDGKGQVRSHAKHEYVKRKQRVLKMMSNEQKDDVPDDNDIKMGKINVSTGSVNNNIPNGINYILDAIKNEETVEKSKAKKISKRKLNLSNDKNHYNHSLQNIDTQINPVFESGENLSVECSEDNNILTKNKRKKKDTSIVNNTSTSHDIEIKDPNNPLVGFIDPITLDEVVKPALSPYGHVMSYDSWIKCLQGDHETGERKNICPITKKPLKKRELIVLTWDNINEYHDKIVNK